MIKTNRELHNLVDRFVDVYNSSDTIDLFKHTYWFDLIIEIYQSQLPFSSSQFANLLVTGGLSRVAAQSASHEYFNSCELLKNYQDRINVTAAH